MYRLFFLVLLLFSNLSFGVCQFDCFGVGGGNTSDSNRMIQAKILFETTRNGITQAAQLERLALSIKYQKEQMEQWVKNWKTGKIRSFTQLEAQMLFFDYMILSANQTRHNLINTNSAFRRSENNLRRSVPSAEYNRLLAENQRLNEARNKATEETIKELANPRHTEHRKELLRRMKDLSRKNQTSLSKGERDQITFEILEIQTGYLMMISETLKNMELLQLQKSIKGIDQKEIDRQQAVRGFFTESNRKKK